MCVRARLCVKMRLVTWDRGRRRSPTRANQRAVRLWCNKVKVAGTGRVSSSVKVRSDYDELGLGLAEVYCVVGMVGAWLV